MAAPSTTPGTLLFAVQESIVERLRARLVDARIDYEPPRREGDMSTEVGVEDVIWFPLNDADGDDGTVSYGTPVMSGPYDESNPLRLDETLTFAIAVQCIRRDGTQAEADGRLAEMLRDVLAVICATPHAMGAEVPGIQSHWVVPLSASFRRGPLGSSGGHGSAVTITVEVQSRLALT